MSVCVSVTQQNLRGNAKEFASESIHAMCAIYTSTHSGQFYNAAFTVEEYFIQMKMSRKFDIPVLKTLLEFGTLRIFARVHRLKILLRLCDSRRLKPRKCLRTAPVEGTDFFLRPPFSGPDVLPKFYGCGSKDPTTSAI